MAIIDTLWFSGAVKSFGIVLVDTGYEKKAYLGLASGIDEKLDSEEISRIGAKLLPSQAEKIFNHLKK